MTDRIIIDVCAIARKLAARQPGRITAMHEIRLSAPVACPACGRPVAGRWAASQREASQRCGACGHVFAAAWPGFEFQPEVVTAPASR